MFTVSCLRNFPYTEATGLNGISFSISFNIFNLYVKALHIMAIYIHA